MKNKLNFFLGYYRTYSFGKKLIEGSDYMLCERKTKDETNKNPNRYDIINFLLNQFNRKTNYLEIGVRNPDDNFVKILANKKYGVDPGLENEKNPVDFKMTSDEFFNKLRNNELLEKTVKFDVIFIDGLHLADQVKRDVENSLDFLFDDGFIVLHDCNPPTSHHAREDYHYRVGPAKGFWNGTTWKAFFNFRKRNDLFSCCIDTDWGVGIISKKLEIGNATKVKNPFYEFHVLDVNRKDSLNLITFDEFENFF